MIVLCVGLICFVFFKQKTAYEVRISDWSSDVCSSDLPILVQGIQPGGQLMTTTDVENYPGFADVIQGPWLMEQMQKQAEHVGTSLVWDTVVDVDLSRRDRKNVV